MIDEYSINTSDSLIAVDFLPEFYGTGVPIIEGQGPFEVQPVLGDGHVGRVDIVVLLFEEVTQSSLVYTL